MFGNRTKWNFVDRLRFVIRKHKDRLRLGSHRGLVFMYGRKTQSGEGFRNSCSRRIYSHVLHTLTHSRVRGSIQVNIRTRERANFLVFPGTLRWPARKGKMMSTPHSNSSGQTTKMIYTKEQDVPFFLIRAEANIRVPSMAAIDP